MPALHPVINDPFAHGLDAEEAWRETLPPAEEEPQGVFVRPPFSAIRRRANLQPSAPGGSISLRCQIPPDLRVRVEIEAERRDVSLSAVVRDALGAHLR